MNLLPIDHKAMTRREAADLLNGLAALIESYPTEHVFVSVNVEGAAASEGTGKKGSSSRSRASRSGTKG